ncbi:MULTISPECIES: hypothetical protein [unclassified Tenacibaculum]|uniref:hypothetical protein n=1 Tax=unclassified Tenacibaculum TaxID=2635139 RepID=UPI001F3714F5|nr:MULTISPECIES: hypothetical protein [unclassified Tenacibaculum]MCF2873193.1 hypothetical protein [Tenacibaculum sp. Cn5-1]MCF2933349.1 hypothetical protein [Tenacibaculum sp. Cn5-34]MCG7510070.1 hypothetical protein [Tenacibaculum sp. Cn5-46]
METLKIEIPKGFIVKNFDKETGEIELEAIPKKITEAITTIQDVLDDNNITQEKLDKMFENTPEHLKYQYIIELLCKSLNEEWVPDWSNPNEHKYYPWFKMSSSGFRYDDHGRWVTFSDVGSHLCFKSPELAKYAGEQFTDVFRKFMIIEQL